MRPTFVAPTITTATIPFEVSMNEITRSFTTKSPSTAEIAQSFTGHNFPGTCTERTIVPSTGLKM